MAGNFFGGQFFGGGFFGVLAEDTPTPSARGEGGGGLPFAKPNIRMKRRSPQNADEMIAAIVALALRATGDD